MLGAMQLFLHSAFFMTNNPQPLHGELGFAYAFFWLSSLMISGASKTTCFSMNLLPQ